MKNYSLLPENKKYSDILWIFFTPYLVYVGMNTASDYIDLWLLYLLKIILVTSLICYYKKSYNFGEWKARHAYLAILATPILVTLWTLPLYYSLYFSGTPLPQGKLSSIPYFEYYWLLHTLAATLLVPIFEELFCRVYLLEFIYQSSQDKERASITDKINNTLEKEPNKLPDVSFNKVSIIAVLLFFTLGHSPFEYMSCILYFSATQLLYVYTRSFYTCIITHALTNLAIAFLVKYYGMEFLWF